jgi:putative phosphoesterase
MKIGVLSDTHGYLDPQLLRHFSGCDEIWHAGDIGNTEVIDQLRQCCPLVAVYGNIDDQKMRNLVPENQWLERERLRIWITHIGGTPPRYDPKVRKTLKEQQPDIFVCGHSHILRIQRDSQYNMLYLNPGAAGQQGFHLYRTAVRLELQEGKIYNAEVINLGRRGAL